MDMAVFGTGGANGGCVIASPRVSARRGEPFSSPGQRPQRGCLSGSNRTTSINMKAKTAIPADQEPMGIVISRGSRQEHVPAVFAYVWGPAPEPADETRETKVA